MTKKFEISEIMTSKILPAILPAYTSIATRIKDSRDIIPTMFAIVSKLMGVKAHLVVVPRGASGYNLLNEKIKEIGDDDTCIGVGTIFNLSSPFIRGMFFPELDIVVIKDQKDFFQNLGVVVHECRHAWQKKEGWEFPEASVSDSFDHKVEVDARKFTTIVVDIVGYTSTVLVGYALGMAIRKAFGKSKKEA